MTRRTAIPALADADALVHPIYARLLGLLLQQAEVDGERVLAVAGLDRAALMASDQPLSLEATVRFVLAAMAATGKPWLGLDLGAKAPVSAHGALGYAAVTAPDLGRSLAVLERFGPVRNDALAWTLHPVPGGLVLRGSERVDWGAARGFYLDTVMAATLRVIEAALGHLPAGLQVDLPGAAPAWVAQYSRFGPVAFRFGQPALALRVDAAALALRCMGADARAHASACRDCEAALSELSSRSVAQRVAALLAAVPDGRYPQLAEVAERCGLAPRTLMRRLSAEHTSFQGLLDASRRNQALWLLQHTGLSVEEIAARLGYVDTSNFSRTVRRWFGSPPRALRQAAEAVLSPAGTALTIAGSTNQNRERQHGL
ncbi:AraC family transcriptional regulator [Ideonella sp.]|uniref:AraC family transcriptional regulator n=1 Tax=Ideonella sp. TaxID=1929293 RepID=UPI003BB5A34A